MLNIADEVYSEYALSLGQLLTCTGIKKDADVCSVLALTRQAACIKFSNLQCLLFTVYQLKKVIVRNVPLLKWLFYLSNYYMTAVTYYDHNNPVRSVIVP